MEALDPILTFQARKHPSALSSPVGRRSAISFIEVATSKLLLEVLLGSNVYDHETLFFDSNGRPDFLMGRGEGSARLRCWSVKTALEDVLGRIQRWSEDDKRWVAYDGFNRRVFEVTDLTLATDRTLDLMFGGPSRKFGVIHDGCVIASIEREPIMTSTTSIGNPLIRWLSSPEGWTIRFKKDAHVPKSELLMAAIVLIEEIDWRGAGGV